MNYILMVYTDQACKEFALPNIDNANHEIVIAGETFGFSDDCKVYMEIVDGQWSFLEDYRYQIKGKDKKAYGVPLVNGDVFEIAMRNIGNAVIIVVESDTYLQVYRKYNIAYSSDVTIGKDENNSIVYSFFELVSRRHARIYRNQQGMVIEDTSSNGVFVNDKRMRGMKQLEFCDRINIFGLHLIYLGDILGICSLNEMTINNSMMKPYEMPDDTMVGVGRNYKMPKEYFHRAPRNLLNLYTDDIEIEPAPDAKKEKKKPLLMTLGPSFTMAIPMMMGSMMMVLGGGNRRGITMFTGMVTAISSAILGVTWAVVNLKYAKEEGQKEEEARFSAYSNYLIETTEFIKEKYDFNTKMLLEAYPDANQCCSYDSNSAFLWNRNDTHDDFLFVRLGIGDAEFQADIKIPKKGFKFGVSEDFLAQKPKSIKEQYKKLKNVPVGVDLAKNRLIGIIGGEGKAGAVEVARTIIAQIVSSICYTDVKLIVAYDEKSDVDKKNWSFAKWLPHVWAEDKKSRYFATNRAEASDVFFEVANIIRMREEEKSKDGKVKPQYILFLANPELLEGELLSKYIFEEKEEYGLITFLMVDKYEDLPNACEQIIQNDQYFRGFYNVSVGEQSKVPVQFDTVSEEKLENFTRGLASIEVKEMDSNGEIPNSLDFFEMYGVSSLDEFNVLNRWKKNRTYESMKAMIGWKAGSNKCYLDIHEKYHGPHGLIAGTTGSGKSETLQTYMLSLALNFSPYDVGFFVIDFKGGGMANLFTGLPHLIGQISNLSGNQVRRAMVSIKSENKRRQRIFNEHGVNNINLYTRLLKNNEASIPVPHLFIIIDEFAELKREEPEFMKELISVAQVGRSLGVHLILATQKPSGTVDDNIWSNTKFRLCLRVADKADSKDMLHKPDAAYITQSGRCYLQVGNDEIYELFQSGWSGAVYDETEMGQQDNIATMLTVDGKAAIIGSKTKIKKKEQAKKKWISQLVQAMCIAMEKNGMTISQIQETVDAKERLYEEVFLVLQEMGLDFPDSKYNRLRLDEFVKLWNPQNEEVDVISDQIIQSAIQNSKKLPELKERTQLDAVVEYLNKVAKENGYTHNIQLWMPLLPTDLYLNQLDGYAEHCYDENGWKPIEGKWNLETVIGLCDDPENQAQFPLKVSFSENGHHAVCGSVVSGKSTFLQSVVYGLITRYTPQQLNLYLIDFSSQMLGAFENAAHVGGVMYESDMDKINKCFHMIAQMLEERKQLFRGGNYSQYVQVHGVTIPAVIVAIDNMANFREKTGDKYADLILSLTRDAAGYGIYFLISAAGVGSSEIPNKVKDNIKTTICLEMGDRYKYMEAMGTNRLEIMPEEDIKGRGLAIWNGTVLEFQAAMALPAEDDYARSEKIMAVCEKLNAMWDGPWAKKVPEIPEKPVLAEYTRLPEYTEYLQEGSKIPIGYNQLDASIAYVDLSRTYCYMVSGKKKSGKNNFMRVLMEAMSRMECDVCVFDEANGRLKKPAENYGFPYYTEDSEIFDYWQGLTPEFVRRNKIKKQCQEDDLNEIEIYQRMREEKPIFIFIGNLTVFMRSIYSPEEGVGKMSGFMENITEKGMYHNIFFFINCDVEETALLSGRKAFINMKDYKAGIHFGGNTAGQRIFKFTNIPYKEENKSLKAGIGYTPTSEDEEVACKVIVPLAK